MLLSGKICTTNKLFRFIRGGFFCCFLSFGVLCSEALSKTPSEVEAALDSVYSDDRYQKQLPLEIKEPKIEKKAPPLKKKKPEKLDFTGLEVLGKILIYGFLILVIVLLGKAIFNYLNDLKRRPQNKTVLEDKPVSYSRVTDMPEELSKETLEYADQLAQKGQFEAAIRALLFCCLKHVRESYHSTLPAALTNREILKSDWLPSDVRQKMGVIVDAEELTEFGGRSAGEQEFNACREAFHIFVRPRTSSVTVERAAI
ncbi:hypothetical protein [Kiloniella antarctica]|uniref:DUF4129 domain-containing protein n=1 Tax=Kiloniella antarctica TaxID=1550907 RepID=A0ABW5BK87_9PROT